MSSRTFQHDGEEIQILGLPENKAISIYVLDSDGDEAQLELPASKIPGIALAILEAANHDMGSEVSLAMEYLERYTKAVAEKESEAKEQAELESEALDYWKAFHKAPELASFDDIQWSDLMPETQAKWLAVARRAREMRNEKKVSTTNS